MKNKFLENPEKNWQNYRGRHGNSLKKDLDDIGELLEREKDRLKALEKLGIINPDEEEEFLNKSEKFEGIDWRSKETSPKATNKMVESDVSDFPGMRSPKPYQAKVGISDDVQTAQKTPPASSRRNLFVDLEKSNSNLNNLNAFPQSSRANKPISSRRISNANNEQVEAPIIFQN